MFQQTEDLTEVTLRILRQLVLTASTKSLGNIILIYWLVLKPKITATPFTARRNNHLSDAVQALDGGDAATATNAGTENCFATISYFTKINAILIKLFSLVKI